MEGVSDTEFFQVSQDIGGANEILFPLGYKLGFSHTRITGFLAENRMDGSVGVKGTLNMFQAWKQNT